MKAKEKKIRTFVEPLVQEGAIAPGFVVHPSGLLVPAEYDTGFDDDLYVPYTIGSSCPVAVLDEDTFADALHLIAEKQLPDLLMAAIESQAEHAPVAHLLPTMRLLLDCVDWSAVEDEWDDDMIAAMMTASGEIHDYVDDDGFWLIVKPSGNLVTALIELDPKGHAKWVTRPAEKRAA